ncbi:MAG: hypothetical protein DMF12_10335 [Verrucomicrobia bacterium]|nr:MAG: hypothetical protein DMF12_10335 [Verrucomicrobiota bacterium]
MSFRAQRSGVEKSLAVWIKNRDSSTSLGMTKKAKAYARAGVDVDLGNRLKRQIQSLVKDRVCTGQARHRRRRSGKSLCK